MTNFGDKFAKIDKDNFVRLSIDNNGDPRKFIILNTPESKRFAGYIMMNRDIDLVLEAINELKKVNYPIIQQSILFFSIITYAKCFVSNDGNRSSLNYNDIFKNSNNEVKNEHNRIMDLRNEYVAHAGSQHDSCVIMGTLFEAGNMVIGIDVNTQLNHVVNMPTKLNDFIELCKVVKEAVSIKLDKAKTKVLNYVSNLEINELSKHLIIPKKNEMYTMVEIEDNSDSGYKKCEFIRI